MQSSKFKTILVFLAAALILGGGTFLYWLGTAPEPKPEVVNTAPEEPEIFTVVGRVASVDKENNVFVVAVLQEQGEYAIRPGARTEITRMIFPFDIKNPPKEATFVPERKTIAISDLETGVQVFIRSSHAIKAGQDIVNPLEVQWLP